MSRITIPLFLLASAAFAADRFTWLPMQTNVVGIAATTTDTTYYGVQVFMDSDNPDVNEFAVTVVLRDASGEIRTLTATVPRNGKAENVKYSTAYGVYVGTSPDFEVLAIQVKAVSGKSVTKPIPGKEY